MGTGCQTGPHRNPFRGAHPLKFRRPASNSLLGLVLSATVALACRPPYSPGQEPDCDPRTLAVGEARVRQIPCSDEQISGGEARVGDWLLESDVLRVGIRGPGSSLSELGLAGGTAVDISAMGAEEELGELIPEFLLPDGSRSWLQRATLNPVEEDGWVGIQLDGELSNGDAASFTWWITPSWPFLVGVGTDNFRMVPMEGQSPIGDHFMIQDELNDGLSLLLIPDGQLSEDLGGDLRFSGVSSWYLGSGLGLDTLSEGAWALEVDVESDGEWVWVVDDNDRIVRALPVINGAAQGLAPASGRTVFATRSGHQPSERLEPWPGLLLEVGNQGILTVESRDAAGRPIPVRLQWEGGGWYLPAGGGPMNLGERELFGWVHAGPAYEARPFGPVQVSGEQRLAVVLDPVAGQRPSALADFSVRAWPDPQTRRSIAGALQEAAAEGANFAIPHALDRVSSLVIDDYTDAWLHAEVGLRSAGEVLSWPWSANSRRPGWGAIDGTSLDADDLLAATTSQGARLSIVNADWLAAAGPPSNWEPLPDALQIANLTEAPIYFSLLDQRVPLSVVGPKAWLLDVEPQAATPYLLERAFLERTTVATNGPWLSLRKGTAGPGDTTSGPGFLELRLACPAWMPVDTVELYGSNGILLQSWSLSPGNPRLTVNIPTPNQSWVVAVARGPAPEDPLLAALLDDPSGNGPWAMTSALYVDANTPY